MNDRLDPDRFWARLGAALGDVPAEERTPPPGARVGAVLVLLEESDDGLRVVLTRRRRDLRSHPGQVSFPGGRLDPGETVEEAALREAFEEVGVNPDCVEVLGASRMFYIPPSRFWVVPVVARWRDPHPLTENPWEVEAVLHVPLAQLLDPARWRHTPMSFGGSAWAWQLDDDLLWGATAIVMAALLEHAVEDWRGGQDPHDLGEDVTVRPWETAPLWGRPARLEGELPSLVQDEVAHVTAAQLRTVRAWLDRHGVGPLSRAEQAGRALAQAVRRLHRGGLVGARVTVLAGPSSNGAGGLVAARLLAAAGAHVEVRTAGAPRFPEQTHVLRAAGVAVLPVEAGGLTDATPPGEVVVDAMLGIGAEPPLRDLPELAVRWLQRYDVPVVALEVPSGLVADAGLRGPAVGADVTVALGLPVVGLRERVTHAYVGDLYLADLGIPAAAWQAAGVAGAEAYHFADGPLVRLAAAARATDAGTPDQGSLPPA